MTEQPFAPAQDEGDENPDEMAGEPVDSPDLDVDPNDFDEEE